ATGTQRLATKYQFDEVGLEEAIERTIAMSDAECSQLGAHARTWFADNKRGFGGRAAGGVWGERPALTAAVAAHLPQAGRARGGSRCGASPCSVQVGRRASVSSSSRSKGFGAVGARDA